MLLTLQIPFADVRPFLSADDTKKLPTPMWPGPRPGRAFIYRSGGIKSRKNRYVEPWIDEARFADLHQAIKFPAEIHNLKFGSESEPVRLRLAFRRFLSDRSATARAEFGFARIRGDEQPLSPQGLLALLLHTLTTKVTIAPRNATIQERDLVGADRALADHLLRATTQLSALRDGWSPPSWWVSPGTPLLIVQYAAPDEASGLAGPAATFPDERLESAGLRLSYRTVKIDELEVRVWAIETAGDSDSDAARGLRIHLARLHAERECLSRVLRLISSRSIPIVPGSRGTDLLQQYLRWAFRVQSEGVANGLPTQAILTSAYESDELVTPGERVSLLEELTDVRLNIRRLVERSTAPVPGETSAAPRPYVGTINVYETRTNVAGDQYTANQAGAQGPNAHVHDVTFNQIWEASGEDLDLKTLADELAELCARLRQDASESEQALSAGAVDAAEKAAAQGDGPKALKFLGQAGRWALDVATQLGLTVAEAALRMAMGL
jgi:hypothetical protein